MTTLLLGASGFIGAHLAEALASAGHQVLCPLRPARLVEGVPPSLARAGVEVTPDASSNDRLSDLVRARRPHTVVDAAWSGVHGAARDDDGIQHANLVRVQTVVAALEPDAATTWIGLGSQAEYGFFEGRVCEDLSGRPGTAYGRAKGAVHRFLADRLHASGTRFAWARVFGVYGPRQPAGWLIPDMISTMSRHLPVDLTTGEQRCDYLYVGDLADACVRLLENRSADGVFNLGSGRAVAVREVASTLKPLLSSSSELRFGAIPHRPGQSMFWEADISRLRSATGWAPTTSLAAGLERTVRSWRNGS